MDFACTSKTCPEQIKALSGVPTPARRAFFGVKHGVAALHGARGKKPRLVWTSVALSVPPITEEPGTLTQYRVPLSVFLVPLVLGIEPKTPESRVAGARPNHQPVGDLEPIQGADSCPCGLRRICAAIAQSDTGTQRYICIVELSCNGTTPSHHA
jgi:hypothetical protein